MTPRRPKVLALTHVDPDGKPTGGRIDVHLPIPLGELARVVDQLVPLGWSLPPGAAIQEVHTDD